MFEKKIFFVLAETLFGCMSIHQMTDKRELFLATTNIQYNRNVRMNKHIAF